MSDLEHRPDSPDNEEGRPTSGERRPSPGAQAASRARRIGGRPVPSPRSAADAGGTPDEAEATPAEAAASTERVTVTKEPEPAHAAPAAEEPSEDAAKLRRTLDRLRWIPAIVAAVAVVVLAGAIAVRSHGTWWAKESTAAVREEVLAAAKTCLARMNTYDYRKLDEAEAAGLACTTGEFTEQYRRSMESIVKTLAPQRKSVQITQVNKAGIESVSEDGNQWVILIFGQQQITNNTTAKGKPRFDLLAARVTMDRVGDKWLISKLAYA